MSPFRTSARRIVPFCLLTAAPAIAQESQARFDAPVVVADPLSRFETLADMNADGYMDALSCWWVGTAYSSCHLQVFLNDQTGKLVPADNNVMNTSPALPQAVAPWNIDTGDFDGDGLPEVLIGVGWQIQVLRSQGAGDLQVWFPVNGSEIVEGLLVDDYDQDGALDVAVLHGALTIYHVDPVTLAFTPFTEIQSSFDASLFRVEMNGDGLPDLMVSDATDLRLYPVVGGQLQSPTILAHQAVDPKPQAGDLDGDGDEDILVFDISTYTVMRRNGRSGGYTPEYGNPGGTARFLHDLDGDGDLDGVCCGGGGPTEIFNNSASSWRMSFNDGLGNFSVSLELPGLGSFRLAGAADLDHDGDLDLVAGRTVFYAHGPWEQVAAKTALTEPWPAQLSDFDCDADVDLQLRPNGVRRNLSDSNTTSFVPHMPPAPAGTQWLPGAYVGDFDGDDDEDMVVTAWASPGFAGQHILLNEGGGSFAHAGEATAGLPMGDSAASPEDRVSFTTDFDADGDLDIVAVTLFGDRTKLWANDGAGHFTLSATLPASYVQAVADFNGDGIPDLMGHKTPGGGGSYDFLVGWKGLGNGAFGPGFAMGAIVNMNTDSGRLAVGDLDADGDLDVAVGDNNGAVYVLENNLSSGQNDMSMQQFTAVTIGLGQTSNSSQTTVCDVDGDGLLDILVSPVNGGVHMAPNATAVYLRKGDNTGFESPIVQVVRATAAADCDGDGDVDAIGPNIWLNTRMSGPNASATRQTETGTPDAFGMTPTLGGKGPYHVGHPVDIRITGAPPQVNGFLFVVDGPFPAESPEMASVLGFGFSRSLKRIPFHTSGVAGWSGTGAWRLSFTVPPYVAGSTRTYVALMPDPAAPGHSVRSNEFSIRYVP